MEHGINNVRGMNRKLMYDLYKIGSMINSYNKFNQ